MVDQDSDDDEKPAFDPSQPFRAQAQKPVFDPSQPFQTASPPGIIQRAADTLDSFTGAPTRAAISAAETTPGLINKPSAAFGAFMNQFGEDPNEAPGGKQLLAQAGLSAPETPIPPISPLIGALNLSGRYPTWNDAAGAATDMAANFTNLIPAEQISGLLSKAGEAVSPYVAKPIAAAGNAFTGIAKPLIQEFYTNTQDIKNMIGQYGGASAQYAADLRDKWLDIFESFKKAQNDKISDVLNDFDIGNQKISADEVNDSLLSGFGQTNKVTQLDDRKMISDLMDKLDQMTDSDGYITLKDLHAFKRYAQDQATAAYRIMPEATWGQNVAKGSAGVARSLLMENAPYPILSAEAKLADLHDITSSMNKNLLKPDSYAQSLISAGANPLGKDARSLKEMGDLMGYDFVKDARQFATTGAFGDASFVPVDTTGKTVARQALAKTVGGAAGGLVGLIGGAAKGGGPLAALGGGTIGSQIGKNAALFMTSPWALKTGISAVDSLGQGAPGLLRLTNPVQRTWGLLNK